MIVEEKKRVGELFKSKREEMSLSLKEVENATSIRVMYLQAIEDGSVEKFLSPIYALGFLRQYAAFLGLDGERIIKENPKAFILKNPPKKPEFDYGIGTLEIRHSNTNGMRLGSNVLWVGVSVIVLLGAWFFARLLGIF